MKGLSTFSGCGWAYCFTFTWIPPQTLPQICESWVKSYLMQVCKPCNYALIEALEPFKLHPMSMPYLYGWAYGLTLTSIPPQTLPQICENWVKSHLCKPCHYALVEAVEPFKLHPMSMAYIYEIFERLLRLWMGIWLQTHTVTTTDASPCSERFAEILPDASMQTMPLCFV
jgi:hypothetical protein